MNLAYYNLSKSVNPFGKCRSEFLEFTSSDLHENFTNIEDNISKPHDGKVIDCRLLVI